MKNKYLLLTVDTEALPNRAKYHHVDRLMLGLFSNGVAGIREMSNIASEFNSKMIFFMDLCGAYHDLDKVLKIAQWLDQHNQDVELHMHPEYLPKEFWAKTNFKLKPKLLNLYQDQDEEKEYYLFKTFSGYLEKALNRKINAFRSGSFRWNSLTLEILKKLDIPLSFNNTQAAVALGQCPYASSLQRPFKWSNGIIEVPVTEKNFFPRFSNNWWVRFQYPLCSLVRFRPSCLSFIPYSVSPKDDFLVCLMHSWSFLHRDDQGYEYYKNDQRMEQFRKLVKRMSLDFDIIDTRDLLDLINSGKIPLDHTEDLNKTKLIINNVDLKSNNKEKLNLNQKENKVAKTKTQTSKELNNAQKQSNSASINQKQNNSSTDDRTKVE